MIQAYEVIHFRLESNYKDLSVVSLCWHYQIYLKYMNVKHF